MAGPRSGPARHPTVPESARLFAFQIHNRKIHQMPVNIDAIHAHAHAVAQAKPAPPRAPNQSVLPFVELIVIVNQRRDHNQAFDEELVQFDVKAEIADIGNHSVELFAHSLSHKDGLAPFINLFFSRVGGALAFAGFLGNQFQFAWRDFTLASPLAGG